MVAVHSGIWVYITTKTRCANPKNPRWRYYGARDRVPVPSFVSFLGVHGPPAGAGKVLRRIDNEGHFEIGNVRWTRCKSAQSRGSIAKLEQPPVDIPNITRRVYADPATSTRRKSAHVGQHTTPLAMFRLPAKLQCASIRAIPSGRITHLGSASPATEFRRRAAQ